MDNNKKLTRQELKQQKIDKKIKKKQARKRWFRNVKKSLNVLWKHCAGEIPILFAADKAGEIVLNKKQRSKLLSLSKLDEITMKEFKEFKEILIDELGIYDAKEGLKAGYKEIHYRITSGNLLTNRNRQETARMNKEEKDLENLLSRLDELDKNDLLDLDDESFGESKYIGGGIMLKDKLEMSKLRLKQFAFSESFNEISGYKNTVKLINEIVDETLGKISLCESLTKDIVNDEIVKGHLSPIKVKIIEVAKHVKNDEVADNLFSDTLGDAYTAIVETEASYELTGINEENVDEAIKKLDDAMETSETVGDRFNNRVENTLEEDRELVENERDDLIFDPLIERKNDITHFDDEIIDEEKVAVAEKNGGFGESLSSIPTLIHAAMITPAFFYNTKVELRNKKFEQKYGGSAEIKQPLVASSSLSKTVVKNMAKALEIKYGLQLKTLLENTAEEMDNGLVNSRLRKANVSSKANTKLFNGKRMDYDEAISLFSEGKIETNFLGYYESDDLFIIPAAMKVMSEGNNLDLLYLREAMTGTGESGIILDEKIASLPTYINVKIKYEKSRNKMSLEKENKVNDTHIGISIKPRIVKSEELLEIIKKNSFGTITVTKDERTFFQRLGDTIKFWKKKPDSTVREVLKTKSFIEVAQKIEKIKTPLFHIMLDYNDYLNLKEKGIDLFNRETYAKIMRALPIISITIVNEDSGIVLMSDGPHMTYIKQDMDDFVNSTSQLEKALRSDIKFRNNL